MRRLGLRGISEKKRKQFSFDLSMEKLRIHYDPKSPTKAYSEIGFFLKGWGFRHSEGSIYESEKALSNYAFNRIMRRMMADLPWFGKCVNVCHVADISSPHDITRRFREHEREIADKDRRLEPKKTRMFERREIAKTQKAKGLQEKKEGNKQRA